MALSADFCRVGLSSSIGNPSSESLRAERWRRPARGHPPQTVTFFKINMPLSQNQITQAVTELIARRNSGQAAPRLPVICRPADLEDGWQVQQEVTLGLGLPVAGWRLDAAIASVQAALEICASRATSDHSSAPPRWQSACAALLAGQFPARKGTGPARRASRHHRRVCRTATPAAGAPRDL
jgi:hypothetical protein